MFDVAMAETAVVIDILICFTWIKQTVAFNARHTLDNTTRAGSALKNIPGPGANGVSNNGKPF